MLESSSAQILSLQALYVEILTLHLLMPSWPLKELQVALVPEDSEQVAVFKTQPEPFVLHPERKVSHSVLVMEVVLSVHSLILQTYGNIVDAP